MLYQFKMKLKSPKAIVHPKKLCIWKLLKNEIFPIYKKKSEVPCRHETQQIS